MREPLLIDREEFNEEEIDTLRGCSAKALRNTVRIGNISTDWLRVRTGLFDWGYYRFREGLLFFVPVVHPIGAERKAERSLLAVVFNSEVDQDTLRVIQALLTLALDVPCKHDET